MSMRDSKWVTNNQDSFLGRHAYNMTNSLSNSTWDLRNSEKVSKGMSNLGMGMGAGSKLGFEKEREETIKDANASRDRIKTTNTDGTINQSGVEAKQRMHSYAGGIFADKNAVRKSFIEKDLTEAEKQDDKLKSYDKSSMEKKQNYLRNEKDAAMKQQLIDHDTAKAEALNKKITQYNNISNEAKQIYFEAQNNETKGIMRDIDMSNANVTNEKIDKIDDINLKDYKDMSGVDKQKYYAKQPDYLGQRMVEQDVVTGKEMNAFHERMKSRVNKNKIPPTPTSPGAATIPQASASITTANATNQPQMKQAA
jgi:hypothetical protein